MRKNIIFFITLNLFFISWPAPDDEPQAHNLVHALAAFNAQYHHLDQEIGAISQRIVRLTQHAPIVARKCQDFLDLSQRLRHIPHKDLPSLEFPLAFWKDEIQRQVPMAAEEYNAILLQKQGLEEEQAQSQELLRQIQDTLQASGIPNLLEDLNRLINLRAKVPVLLLDKARLLDAPLL